MDVHRSHRLSRPGHVYHVPALQVAQGPLSISRRAHKAKDLLSRVAHDGLTVGDLERTTGRTKCSSCRKLFETTTHIEAARPRASARQEEAWPS